MVDNIYRTRSLGTAAEGLRDQYADGKAARVWEVYIGDKSSRTENYRTFITELLRSRNCKTVLDLACGTGLILKNLILADYVNKIWCLLTISIFIPLLCLELILLCC